MRGNRGITGASLLAAAALLGALIAAAVAGVLSTPTYVSTVSMQVIPLSGSGDPDRILATHVAVIESATLHQDVRTRLATDADFSVQASQRRLSNVLDIEARSGDPATAEQAAEAAADAYVARVPQAQPAQAAVSSLDPASAAIPGGDPQLDGALAAVGGGMAGAAIVLTWLVVAPRVRPRSLDDAIGEVLIELPYPGRRPSRRDEALIADVRSLLTRLVREPGGSDPVALAVTALPGAGQRAVRWVTEILGGVPVDSRAVIGSSGDPGGGSPLNDVTDGENAAGIVVVSDDRVVLGVPDGQRWISVIVARAWIDSERTLRKEVLSRRTVSDVVVILLGAPRPAVVAPLLDRSTRQHRAGRHALRIVDGATGTGDASSR